MSARVRRGTLFGLALIGTALAGAALAGATARAMPPAGDGGGARDATSEEARLGGAGTVFDDGPDAFGDPVAVLAAEQRRAFMVGNALFRANWVAAPASAEGVDGLGPLFNARSCSSCHPKDGRGAPPSAGREFGAGLLLKLTPTAGYGSQLQDQATPGVAPEGRIVIEETPVRGAYDDGTPFELMAPRYSIAVPAYGPLAEGVALGPRIAPQIVGLGLLERVPEAMLLAREDPDDRDGDGISGRARFVGPPEARRLGRFGWKAAQPSVRDQVAAAFANDMGLTSSAVPSDDVTDLQRERMGALPDGGTPELTDHKLDRVAFYSAALAVPAQRGAGEPAVVRGGALFESIGCAACHLPQLETDDGGEIEGLRRQRIHPYTDLLLHDLGEGLADGLSDGDAGPSEWRTPPLWGIGLVPVVNGHERYLHDGRARGLEEAILWHGGEAARATASFRALPADARRDLLAFLRSL